MHCTLAWQVFHWLSVACMLWLLAVTLRAHFAVVAGVLIWRGEEFPAGGR